MVDALSSFVILRLGGCVAIALECKFVILNPSHVILSVAKNLVVKLRTGSVSSTEDPPRRKESPKINEL